jgi:hypothetical protein
MHGAFDFRGVRIGPSRHWARNSAIVVAALLTGCGSGGGDDGTFLWDSCSPAPVISSTPATAAFVGQRYTYVIQARHLCGGLLPLLLCGDVSADLPAGATLNGTQAPYITWTPSPSQANTNAAFAITTQPDPCGARVRQAWAVYVTPDTTPSSVTSVWPAAAASNVPLNTSITANFSEPVDSSSISAASFVVAGPAGFIPGTISVYPLSAAFTPATDLPASSSISVTLTTAIKDPSGNAVTSDYVWTFATAASPPTPPAGWTWNSIDTGVEVEWTSIALDPLDNVYIAYQNGRYTGSNQQQGDVKVATNASGAWQLTVVDNVAPNVPSSISMLINADATAHIAYYEGDFIRELKHATNASGAWLSEIVDPNALNVHTVSMAHDAATSLHLVYDPNGNVTYTTNATSAWATQVLGTNNALVAGVTSAITIDSSGSRHIAYYDVASHALKHFTDTSGMWATDTVDDQGDVGTHVSIAADASGNVHLSYYDRGNGDLKYATNASGAWVAQSVDSAGDVGLGTGIALDRTGHVHISYTDATNHALKYASNASGAWAVRTIDGASNVAGILMSNNGYTSIAVDSTGKVHISYRGGGYLRYATNR